MSEINELTENQNQQRRYNLMKEPNEWERRQIRGIERQREECDRCEGLDHCCYSGDGRGFKPCIIATNLGRYPKNLLYFGVEKCDWLKESERRAKERRRESESDLPRKVETLNENQMRIAEHLMKGDYWLSGNHGSGKTQILREVGERLLKLGKAVKYITQSELLIDLKVTNPEYHEKMKKYRSVEVLLIDDWRGLVSDYNEEQLWVILNHRGIYRKTTIIGSREGIRNQRVKIKEKLEYYEEIRT